MVIHTLNSDYIVIYKEKRDSDFEILVCSAENEPQDRLYSVLKFSNKEDIRWLLGQSLSHDKVAAEFSECMESFIWNGCLCIVYLRKKGVSLREWLKSDAHSLMQRLEAGRAFLEKLLMLNLPLYMLCGILNYDCIIIDELLNISVRYEPRKIVCCNRDFSSEILDSFYNIFSMLFEGELNNRENGRQCGLEIRKFIECLKENNYFNLFKIYRDYLSVHDILKDYKHERRDIKMLIISISDKFVSAGKRFVIPIMIVILMLMIIYGICHNVSDEQEENIINNIGTLIVH